jgi:hypothetical protein
MARTHRAKGQKKGQKQKAPKAGRRRDYRAEYARRVQLGISKGLSRSQARGHARAGERPKPARRVVNRNSKEELAIKVMKGGLTLRDAARGFGLSEQHLRRYAKENVGATWDQRQRKWIIDDQRPRRFPVYSEGELKTLMLPPYDASIAGSFMHAAREFLRTGDRQLLAPYDGQWRGVTDVLGRYHRFETDPNRLYELDSAGELNFPEIYRITAN